MASSNKDNIIFESNARYNKSNVILDLTKDKLLFKKRRFLSADYRITDRFDLDDILFDKECVCISQDKELLTIHLNYAEVQLLFQSVDAARQLKDAIIDLVEVRVKKDKDNKKKDK